MHNPQYIEYLNTFGAEIDVNSQPLIDADALPEEHITQKNEFEIFGRLSQQIIYCCDLIKKIPMGDAEIERTRLIDSIEELKNKGRL